MDIIEIAKTVGKLANGKMGCSLFVKPQPTWLRWRD